MCACRLPTRRALNLLRYNEACSCNRCCSGKALSITYSEFVFVALGIQRAVQHFPILSHKRRDFRKEKLNIIFFSALHTALHTNIDLTQYATTPLHSLL